MSVSMGSLLPPDLLRRLAGDDLDAHLEKVVLLVSVDEEGWPHPALLSYFEVVAHDARTLHLAIGNRSRTARNLRERGRLTLIVVDAEMVYYIKGRAREIAPRMDASPEDAVFRVQVEHVLADRSREEESSAVIIAPITYRALDPSAWRSRGERIFRELRSCHGDQAERRA
ncbi:hypothetical protein HRbin08_02086 [bacterium HR08]|nr:hypothetical protein HRbin08_02086 [bacterium HR08]